MQDTAMETKIPGLCKGILAAFGPATPSPGAADHRSGAPRVYSRRVPRKPSRSAAPAPMVDRDLCVEAVRVCACFNLRRASRAVTRLYDEILGRGGLRSTQFVALVALRIEGEPSLPRLARALRLDRSTLTRNLAPLVKGGLVTVSSPSPSHTATARLTPKGDEAIARCVPFWKEAQERFEAKVGPERWRALLGGLAAVSAGAAEA